jgi:hypothetical protein
MGEREVERIIEQWRASARAMTESEDEDEDPSRPRRGLPRVGAVRAVLVAATVLVVSAVAAMFAISGAQGPQQQPPAAAGTRPAASPSPTIAGDADAAAQVDDWYGVIARVDQARRDAYQSADATPLAVAFLPGGPALALEEARVAALAGSGSAAVGWRTEVLSVGQVQAGPDRAVLRVRDRRLSYQVRDAAGARDVAAAGPATWLVTMQRSDGRWLVQAAVPELTTRNGPP